MVFIEELAQIMESFHIEAKNALGFDLVLKQRHSNSRFLAIREEEELTIVEVCYFVFGRHLEGLVLREARHGTEAFEEEVLGKETWAEPWKGPEGDSELLGGLFS